MRNYDIEFFWDPVCPFAWITSRWLVKVAAQTGYTVDWRLISLRLLNKQKDYATAFPPNYERGHTAGLRMLRVAAKIRAALGREHMGALYEGYGKAYWDQPKGSGMSQKLGTVAHIGAVLHTIGLPAGLRRPRMTPVGMPNSTPRQPSPSAALAVTWVPRSSRLRPPMGCRFLAR